MDYNGLPRSHRGRYADFLCGLDVDFFAAASFGFLPAIGINISF
jgi:hypothetical protein